MITSSQSVSLIRSSNVSRVIPALLTSTSSLPQAPTILIEEIRSNLLNQLLNSVKWSQTLKNMMENGATSFIEVGPGKVLQGLVKRTNRKTEISGYQ